MSNNSSIADSDNGVHYILLFRLIVWGYAGIILSLFGIFGNVITIIVLISRSMRTTSTNIYLTALSCSNILFLLIFIPSYSMRYLLGYRLYMTNQPPFAFEILLTRLPTTPIYNTILLSIIYLTIAVSMDRLVLIKFPLKAKRILTPRTTLLTILSIYIFSIVYCIPYWLEQKYVPELKQCRLTKIGQRIHKYTRIYIYIPVVYLIPFVTLTCINITIIQNLIAKKRRKKSLGAKTNKKKQGDYHITLMLVAVIIVFVLCQLPLLILNAWYAIYPLESSQSLTFHSLNSLGILLIVCNTSTNFLLYCFFGQKFRQTLLGFLGPLGSHSKKPTNLQNRVEKQLEQHCLPKFLPTSTLSAPSTTTETSKVTNVLMDRIETSANTHQPQEESAPLLKKTEEIVDLHPTDDFKPDYQPNLYTCSNGKRILVLKI